MLYYIIINLIFFFICFVFFKTIKYLKINFNHNNILSIHKIEFYFRFFIFLFFWFFFVMFFRFLNLFRDKKLLNILILFENFQKFNFLSIFLVFFIIIFFFRLIIFFFKINFLKVHFFLLSKFNFKFYNNYYKVIRFLCIWPNFFYFGKVGFFLFKYGFEFLIFMIFFYDLYFNNFILIYFVKLLPFFSLYKLLYNMNSYLYYNINLDLDLMFSSVLYPFKTKSIKSIFSKEENNDLFFLRDYIYKLIKI